MPKAMYDTTSTRCNDLPLIFCQSRTSTVWSSQVKFEHNKSMSTDWLCWSYFCFLCWSTGQGEFNYHRKGYHKQALSAVRKEPEGNHREDFNNVETRYRLPDTSGGSCVISATASSPLIKFSIPQQAKHWLTRCPAEWSTRRVSNSSPYSHFRTKVSFNL